MAVSVNEVRILCACISGAVAGTVGAIRTLQYIPSPLIQVYIGEYCDTIKQNFGHTLYICQIC